MTVAVQMPQGEGIASQILKGLSIAQSIYGIKTDRAKYEAMAKEKEKKDALEAKKVATENAKRQGMLLGEDITERRFKGDTIADAPGEGFQKFTQYNPETGTSFDVFIKPKNDSGMTPYQQKQLEHQSYVDSVNVDKAKIDSAHTKQTGETNLRKEYDDHPITKDSDKMMIAYKKLKKAAENPNPTAATDIGVVFNFMKMVDPASTVREGEFATAQNAGSIGDKLMNMYNSVLKGERLQPEQRLNMAQEAYDQMANQLEQQTAINERYGAVAKQYGFRPDNVVRNYELKPLDVKAHEGGGIANISPEEAKAELARRRAAQQGGGLSVPGGGLSVPSMGIK